MAYSIEYAYKVIDEYSGELKKMMKQTENFEKSTHKATKKAGASFGGFFKMVGAIATADLLINAGKSVVDFLKSADAAYLESKMALENVANALETVGKKSGQTLPQLEAFAQMLEGTTSIDADDFLQNVSGKLLKFKNITGETFEQTQMLIADFTAFKFGAAATGEQFASTSEMIGKAMNEPSKAMKMLRGAGINLTESQEKLIKSLEDTGNIKQAQSILFDVMKDYSGFAVKSGNTTAGMIQKIKVQIGNMKEDIGKAIEPIKLNFLSLAVKYMPYLSMATAAIGKVITKITGIILEMSPQIEAVIGNIIDFFDELINAVMYIFQGGKGGNLDEMIVKVFSAITSFVNTSIKLIKNTLITLEPVLNILGMAWGALVEIVAQLMPVFEEIAYFIDSEVFSVIREITKELQPLFDLLPKGGGIISIIVGFLKAYIFLVMQFVKILVRVYATIAYAFINIVKSIVELPKAVGEAITAITKVFEYISQSVSGVFEGLSGFISDVLNAIVKSPLFETISNIVSSILDSITNNPVFEMITGIIDKASMFFGKGNATINNTQNNQTNVPSPMRPDINVNATVGVNAYTEKGVKVVPFAPTGNLGWNGAQ